MLMRPSTVPISPKSGIDPEIDLSVPPADPGVSRLHAVLLKAPDGTWSVIDPGSANGTVVNGTEIPHGQAVPLHEVVKVDLHVPGCPPPAKSIEWVLGELLDG